MLSLIPYVGKRVLVQLKVPWFAAHVDDGRIELAARQTDAGLEPIPRLWIIGEVVRVKIDNDNIYDDEGVLRVRDENGVLFELAINPDDMLSVAVAVDEPLVKTALVQVVS